MSVCDFWWKTKYYNADCRHVMQCTRQKRNHIFPYNYKMMCNSNIGVSNCNRFKKSEEINKSESAQITIKYGVNSRAYLLQHPVFTMAQFLRQCLLDDGFNPRGWFNGGIWSSFHSTSANCHIVFLIKLTTAGIPNAYLSCPFKNRLDRLQRKQL